MENILREYEVRLLDGENRLILVVPVIAANESDARATAAMLAKKEKAASIAIKPQMNSRGYRAASPDADAPQGSGTNPDG